MVERGDRCHVSESELKILEDLETPGRNGLKDLLLEFCLDAFA